MAKKPAVTATVDATPAPEVTRSPEPVTVQAFISGIHCAECKRPFTTTCSSMGKLNIQHEKSQCIYSGKHFEPPTVELQPIQ